MAKPKLSVEQVQELWKESRQVAWSRIQTAYLLEVATLAGAYAPFKDYPLISVEILALGTLLLVGLALIMWRDVQHGAKFKEFLEGEEMMFDFGKHLAGIETRWVVAGVPLALVVGNMVLGVTGGWLVLRC